MTPAHFAHAMLLGDLDAAEAVLDTAEPRSRIQQLAFDGYRAELQAARGDVHRAIDALDPILAAYQEMGVSARGPHAQRAFDVHSRLVRAHRAPSTP